MGLVLGPLLLAWFAGAVCAGFMWYSVLSGDNPVWYAVVVLGCGLLLAFAYLALGLRGFRSLEEVWAFEIPVFFLLNRYALVSAGLALACYLFQWDIPGFAHTRALCFVLMAAASAGALIGTFCAGKFVEKHGIRVTY